MLLIFIRTTIIFLILFLVIRLMGKRQIGEMQPYEFAITLLIAELACIPMADLTIPLGYGIIAILALFILHQAFAVLEKKSIFFSRLISSKPSIVIDSEGIVFKELKRLNIGINELQENLRNAGYSNFDEVEYAIIETNGKFSILEKKKPQDGTNSSVEQKTPLPVCFIEEGKYMEREFERLNMDKGFIKDLLKQNGVKNIKDVSVATYDNNGKLYFQLKGERYRVMQTEFKGGNRW